MTGESSMGMSSRLLVLWGLMGTCIATVSILALAAAAIAYERSRIKIMVCKTRAAARASLVKRRAAARPFKSQGVKRKRDSSVLSDVSICVNYESSDYPNVSRVTMTNIGYGEVTEVGGTEARD